MSQAPDRMDVYLETGRKRVFAGAIDWPGWCRSGRDPNSALQALFDYARRYARALQTAQLAFPAPADPAAFRVVERLEGSATTDFGAPDKAPSSDSRPVSEMELQDFTAILRACWAAFDAAARATAGRELRKGPRRGGRDLEGITRHVLGAEAAYLSRLGWKFKNEREADLEEALRQTRQAVLDGLASAVRQGVPPLGPRGGARWTPRYFVRRAAWHVLDHAWEIEDRIC